MIARFGLFQLI